MYYCLLCTILPLVCTVYNITACVQYCLLCTKISMVFTNASCAQYNLWCTMLPVLKKTSSCVQYYLWFTLLPLVYNIAPGVQYYIICSTILPLLCAILHPLYNITCGVNITYVGQYYMWCNYYICWTILHVV